MPESTLSTPVPVEVWPAATPTPSPLQPGERVLLVSAHPDDETIGAGRLVADHDGPVRAITLTAGEHCVPGLDPEEMATRRLREWRTAAAALGVEAEEGTPRWPDGRLAEHEGEVFDALSVLAVGSDVLVTTWRHDPHPDHQAAGRVVAAMAAAVGARLVEYPVWAPYWMPHETLAEHGYAATQVQTTPEAEVARERALSAYVSQTGSAAPGHPPVVPAAMLARHPHQILVAAQVVAP